MHIDGPHSYAMCYCAAMKKSWKILVILFGGMKCSSYLCTQMQDLRTKPIEGPRWAFLTTEVKGKQLSAPGKRVRDASIYASKKYRSSFYS